MLQHFLSSLITHQLSQITHHSCCSDLWQLLWLNGTGMNKNLDGLSENSKVPAWSIMEPHGYNFYDLEFSWTFLTTVLNTIRGISQFYLIEYRRKTFQFHIACLRCDSGKDNCLWKGNYLWEITQFVQVNGIFESGSNGAREKPQKEQR